MGWNPVTAEPLAFVNLPPYVYMPSPLIDVRNQDGQVAGPMMYEMPPASNRALYPSWFYHRIWLTQIYNETFISWCYRVFTKLLTQFFREHVYRLQFRAFLHNLEARLLIALSLSWNWRIATRQIVSKPLVEASSFLPFLNKICLW